MKTSPELLIGQIRTNIKELCKHIESEGSRNSDGFFNNRRMRVSSAATTLYNYLDDKGLLEEEIVVGEIVKF